MDLRTTFMGIELKNPIIAGASNLINDIDYVKKLEQAGIAAVVYKSLFEEQIQLENLQLNEQLKEYTERNAEMIKLFPDIEHSGPKEHLYKLEKLKEAVSIPVFASLNCVYEETWIEYAKQIEDAGADALELNFYAVPLEMHRDGQSIEDLQVEILKKVKNTISIPLAVKLSSFYTNPLHVISKMDSGGADGFVLFNSLFQPDINIEKESQFYPYNLSSNDDNRLPARFAGLLYDNIAGSICSSTGIYTGKDVVKMILSGADCVQVVSTLYRNSPGHVEKMLEEIEKWMQSKNYDSITDFKGKMSKKNTDDYYAYRRAQYIDILMKTSDDFKKYLTV